MDNLTHSLVGLAAAKVGLEKLSPGATTICVLAANAPDVDVAILLFADRWTFLKEHRGITHAIVGTIFLAVLLPLLFYGVDYAISRFRNRRPNIRLKGLFIASSIASITHPVLDWTNNYGMRFLLPWNERWFYGDFVFIVDPFLWLVLGISLFLVTSKSVIQKATWITAAAILTTVLLLAPRATDLQHPTLVRTIWFVFLASGILLFVLRVGDRWKSRVVQVGIAIALCYWVALFLIHHRAANLGRSHADQIARSNSETVMKLAAMPMLASPLNWDCVFDTDKATYRFRLNLLTDEPRPTVIRYPKPTGELATITEKLAQNERSARIFLGFARFPVVRLEDPDCTTQTLVQLADLRYTEPGRSRGTFALDLPVDCQTDLIGQK
ncbi:MAG TPA: metal-dependent hydrolase [Pyrinomonadaceae bacterium]|nr:metal-dependent hydrolase [Pyrinomonadaceae bacterium]